MPTGTATTALYSIFDGIFHHDLALDHQRRLQAYRHFWLFYLSKHWSYVRDPGDPTITINYCRRLLDILNDFTFKKGFRVVIPDDPATAKNESEDRDFVRYTVEEAWRRNKKELWMLEGSQQGGVTGDLFARVSWEKNDPLEDPYARVDIIPSHLVFPETGGPLGVDRKKLTRVIILNPVFEDVKRGEIPSHGLFSPHPAFSISGATPGNKELVIYGEEWLAAKYDRFTGEKVADAKVRYYRNKEFIEEKINPLGEIPVVHIPNYPLSGELYGISDLVDAVELNRELNEKITDISDIINYHGCVDVETEILTQEGWKNYTELREGDLVLGLDSEKDEIIWQPVEVVNIYDHEGSLVAWDNHIDSLTTPNHRWLAERRVGRRREMVREMVRTSESSQDEVAAHELTQGSRIVVGGGKPQQFAGAPIFDDEFVELLGWWITEGSLDQTESGSDISFIHQSANANPQWVEAIRRLQRHFQGLDETMTEQKERPDGVIGWYLGTALTKRLLEVAPDKTPTWEFLRALTLQQAVRLFEVLIAADGTTTASGGQTWYQDSPDRRGWFQMLAGMLGHRTRSYENIRGHGVVDVYQRNTILVEHTKATPVQYCGKVWCPTVGTGIWFARRRGSTYWTGNSPVTIVSGAKLKDLERGANRVWGLPQGASAKNLELAGDLGAAVQHWNTLKQSMLELMGVPEQALGRVQNLGNVSGVALAIQYLPMMEKRTIKTLTYGLGLRLINRLIMKVTELGDPAFGAKMESLSGNRYRNDVVFPNPMPQDEAVELEKARSRLDIGLSTRRLELERMGYSQAEVESIISGALEEAQEETEAMFGLESGPGRGQTQNMRGGVPEVRGQKVSDTLAARSALGGETGGE